jgi:hypothetical protein
MEEVRVRVVRIFVVLAFAAVALGSGAGLAKEKAKGGSAPSAPAKAKPSGEPVNACGCYRDDKGGCICTDKKAKCDCPGECEPVGCSEKRDKEMEREMAAEIKRAQEDEKKRKEAQEAQENGTAATPDGGEEAPPPAVAAKPAKPSRKDAAGKTESKPGAKPDK